MSLSSPTEDEKYPYTNGFSPVMPAWMAGIQVAGSIRSHPCQPGFQHGALE
jgi:hypothetical protein